MNKRLLTEMRFMMERLESPRMTDTELTARRKKLINEDNEIKVGDRVDGPGDEYHNLEVLKVDGDIITVKDPMGRSIKYSQDKLEKLDTTSYMKEMLESLKITNAMQFIKYLGVASQEYKDYDLAGLFTGSRENTEKLEKFLNNNNVTFDTKSKKFLVDNKFVGPEDFVKMFMNVR